MRAPGWKKRAEAEAETSNAVDEVTNAVDSVDLDEGTTFSLEELQAPGPFPNGVVTTQREKYLSAEDFEALFGMDAAAFDALPAWKKKNLKTKHKLFERGVTGHF